MPERGHRQGVAIVGMAALFPGSPDLDAYHRNLERGFDAITAVPADRWDPVFFDATGAMSDRIYVNRGGFLESGQSFDAPSFGVMPVAAQGAEPDQLLALDVATRALRDAGYMDRAFERDRASVIVGRGGYLTAGIARLDQRVRGVEQLAQSLRALVPGIEERAIDAVKASMRDQLGPYGPDTAIGLVPNLAASRIANRLDLHGSAYTIDAACASSLVAVDHACRELEHGLADLVIAGGVHLCHDPSFYSVFCQLGALSRSQRIRPFDRRADGLLIGEGVGMIVLKRLSDAERDGDRVYAVVRGTGVSSDGRGAGLMTPAVDGQLLALERAWDSAALDRASVGLIEAHGTGTAAGDAAELTTLARFFGPATSGELLAGLGSVKSMIGHAMPAAGMAGLVKAALAVHHATLLPTLHCEEPRAELSATRFRAITQAEPWTSDGTPRRAGVNAFGFGGVNAHVVIEQHGKSSSRRAFSARPTPSEPPEPLLLCGAESPEALAHALGATGAAPLDGAARIAIFNPTPERLTKAKAIIARGEPWRGRDDIWFSPHGLLSESHGKVAFLFPGVDASFRPRVDDVARDFGLGFHIPADTTSLKDLGMGIVAVGRTLDAALRAIGLAPDVIAGHSIGEWSGMISSEMIPRSDVDDVIAALAPEAVDVPGVVFVAAGCGLEQAQEAIEGLAAIAISHDNCPHQVLLCGRADSATVAHERLARAGILCQKLPFQSGYHSPLFADFLATPRRVLAGLPLAPSSTPLWSATTCAPYPNDVAEVRRLAVDHLVRPVRFRELVLALYEHGVRVFVQAGTGSLVGFVDDTLRGKPHLAIAANVPARSGLAQLRRVAAALSVEGKELRLERLGIAAPFKRPGPASVRLELGVPLVRFTSTLPSPASTGIPFAAAEALGEGALASDRVAVELAANMQALAAAQTDILGALKAHRERAAQRERVFRRELSVAKYPALLDHSFYRQAAGWPNVSDRYPVVPMTMVLALMMEAARELVPDLVPIAVERVRAYRWLAVAPPVEVTVHTRFDGVSRVDVTIDGYAAGIVEMAHGYPDPPPPDGLPLDDERPAPITARDLYADRWMFHGPAYQGVVALGPLGRDGIRGKLTALRAQGGLLDNAGQLLGYWVMQNATVDRLAMPVIIDRCAFYGPDLATGEIVDCVVRVKELSSTLVRADVELAHGGRVWAKIEGWEDRRFDSDARVWEVLIRPETNVLTEMREEGFGHVTQPWRSTASRDLLARRYLTERERATHSTLAPRAKNEWLLGRIAIKDCVRATLWQRGFGPLFPAEIEVDNEPSGRPVVRGPFKGDLHVSVAHKDGAAVARVSPDPRVGVDLEKISPRGPEFEAIAFTPEERALFADGPERDTSVARFWVAKEAVAKALGTGLEGNPRRFVVTRLDGARLTVQADGNRFQVETTSVEGHIVGWTCA